MSVVILRHTLHRGRLGNFVSTLERRGFSYRFIECFDADLDDFDALAPELVIVTGGAPGVYQADIYPFLAQEIKILEKRLAADRPTFGICLGAQLMAAALGARVYPGENGIERGWCEVHVTEAGQDTPVRNFDASKTKVMQWHQDTFDLPQGAILLATSKQYQQQAFSYGEKALAVQFHPEMNAHTIKGALAGEAYSAARGTIDVVAMRKETDLYVETMIRQAHQFMDEWLDRIFADRLGQERDYA